MKDLEKRLTALEQHVPNRAAYGVAVWYEGRETEAEAIGRAMVKNGWRLEPELLVIIRR
jgi:hypothetical protein